MVRSTLQLEDDFKLLGTRLAGRILIESVVARGGFGLVYRGHHEDLGVPVAVKLLLTFSQYSNPVREEFAKRFMQESRLIAKLTHPASVRLVDHGVDLMPDGEVTPWLALEWLDGVPLNQEMRARNDAPYSLREALALMRPALEALAEAHGQGIAHRDITPSNVFVSARGSGGPRTRLIDFGVAREMEDDAAPGLGYTATRSTVHAFTMRYAAPEQVSHARTGPWTDVHAFGLMLTQMLTGEAPYPGSDETERVAHVLSPQRPTPAKFGVDVGPIEDIIARCVALRPAERYPNAAALLEALDSLGEPAASTPPRPALAVTRPSLSPVSAPVISSPIEAHVHTAPSGLVTSTEVLAPASSSRDSRIVGSVIVGALCVLGLVAVSSGTQSTPLVASVPRSQTATPTVIPAVAAPQPVVLQQLAPSPVAPEVLAPVAPTVPESVVSNGAPRHRRPSAHHSGPSAEVSREPQELPRCRSLHERNCRP